MNWLLSKQCVISAQGDVTVGTKKQLYALNFALRFLKEKETLFSTGYMKILRSKEGDKNSRGRKHQVQLHKSWLITDTDL